MCIKSLLLSKPFKVFLLTSLFHISVIENTLLLIFLNKTLFKYKERNNKTSHNNLKNKDYFPIESEESGSLNKALFKLWHPV